MDERFMKHEDISDPTDPHTWLLYAKSNLLLAEKGGKLKGVRLEDLCFNAQQAAEKALKAVCLANDLEFPKTHSLVRLMDIIEVAGILIPANIKKADTLTQFAVETRYPSLSEEITKQEYKEAILAAARVVFWAEKSIE
jgi:HEPN domain-containing protein